MSLLYAIPFARLNYRTLAFYVEFIIDLKLEMIYWSNRDRMQKNILTQIPTKQSSAKPDMTRVRGLPRHES